MRTTILLLLVGATTTTLVLARPQGFGAGGFAPHAPPLIPPGFDAHLPREAKERLIALHFDKDLTYEQRRDRIEEVMDALPKEVLEKLPLPPGLERLPEASKARFRALHMDRTLGWRKRQELVRKAVRELPEEEQRIVEPPRPPMPPPPFAPFGQGFQPGAMEKFGGQGKDGGFPFPPPPPPPVGLMGFPPHPPPGFEKVLAPTIYKQLLTVHQDQKLSVDEKKRQIDRIMANVPQEQLDRLPLPPNFERLPEEAKHRLRAIMHNFAEDWETRHNKVRDFIRSLPVEQRRLARPPTPPGFEALPDETQDQIDELFLEDKLSPPERFAKIHEIIQKLPAEVRAKLPPPPPFFQPFPAPPHQGMNGERVEEQEQQQQKPSEQ